MAKFILKRSLTFQANPWFDDLKKLTISNITGGSRLCLPFDGASSIASFIAFGIQQTKQQAKSSCRTNTLRCTCALCSCQSFRHPELTIWLRSAVGFEAALAFQCHPLALEPRRPVGRSIRQNKTCNMLSATYQFSGSQRLMAFSAVFGGIFAG